MGERWRQFKSNLMRKWALAADQDGVEDTVYDKYGISKEKWAQFCQTRRDPSWEVCSLPFKFFFILNMMFLYFILPISNIIV